MEKRNTGPSTFSLVCTDSPAWTWDPVVACTEAKVILRLGIGGRCWMSYLLSSALSSVCNKITSGTTGRVKPVLFLWLHRAFSVGYILLFRMRKILVWLIKAAKTASRRALTIPTRFSDYPPLSTPSPVCRVGIQCPACSEAQPSREVDFPTDNGVGEQQQQTPRSALCLPGCSPGMPKSALFSQWLTVRLHLQYPSIPCLLSAQAIQN